MSAVLSVIDDDPAVRLAIGHLFGTKGYDVHDAASADEGIRLVRETQPDIVILDSKLPDRTGLETLATIKDAQPDCVVIMLTAFGSIPDAVDAMKKGAFDYLVKPVDIEMIEVAVSRAREMRDLKKENLILKDIQTAALREGIAGASREVHGLLLMIHVLAENPNTTVLIEGESGTGKELAARTIHRLSGRREKPFLEINCASLSEHLTESELFGHEKGAFTDAREQKRGLMEIADGGTLFLDEVGELTKGLQPKLLRAIETKTFRRVGGTRDIHVDVRIIAATNSDLKKAVQSGGFREDLYYRLRVMPLKIPPLRERGGDAVLLARQFVREKGSELKKKITGLSPECEDYIRAYNWPGNVRELKNVIERAVILAPGDLITPEQLPSEMTDGPKGRPFEPANLDEIEKRHIREVLTYTKGNHSMAARILGISRSTLLNKVKRF